MLSKIVILSCFLVSGCGAVGPAKQILSNPADNIDCHYVRAGVKWNVNCKADGTIKIEDDIVSGLPLPGLF